MADSDVITAHELRFERLLDAPVDTVWRYLADSELRGRWFMPGKTEPRAGGAFEMVFAHENLSDDKVTTPERFAANAGKSWSERIVAIEPPHRLAFTWMGGEAGTVTIELSPEGERTRLVLVHSGLRGPEDARSFGGGWTAHLAVLEARLAGRAVPNFWTLHAESEARAKAAIG